MYEHTCNLSNEAIQSVNFSDKRAFADTSNRRITRELPNRSQILSQEQGTRTSSSGGCCRFTSCMTTSYNHNCVDGREKVSKSDMKAVALFTVIRIVLRARGSRKLLISLQKAELSSRSQGRIPYSNHSPQHIAETAALPESRDKTALMKCSKSSQMT